MSIEHEGGYIPPQEWRAPETEQSEAQKFAETYVAEKVQEAETQANTIRTPDGKTIDLRSLSGTEQNSEIAAIAAGEKFPKLKATPEIAEKLFDMGIIDVKATEKIVWDMLEKSAERFVPKSLLEKLAQQDRRFAQLIGKWSEENIAKKINPQFPDHGRLIYAAKALKYGDVMREHALIAFRDKEDLIGKKSKAFERIFNEDNEDKERNPNDQKVAQAQLLARKSRDVFEDGTIPQEKIPDMIRNVISLFRENKSYVGGQEFVGTQEAVIDLLRMGKLDEETAKTLIAEMKELTK